MNPPTMQTLQRWYAIYTHPKQEERVDSNLRAWKVETFVPRHQEPRYNRYSSKATHLVKPLFPRYLFARFSVYESLHKIRFTRGVYSIVSIGNQPAPIDDELIVLIQSRRNEHGYIVMEDVLKLGDEVMVESGPFKGFIGVFERGLEDAARVMILLTTVAYQSHVVIPRENIRKISPKVVLPADPERSSSQAHS